MGTSDIEVVLGMAPLKLRKESSKLHLLYGSVIQFCETYSFTYNS